MNTVNSLSGGDITKWNEIYDLPYNDVFVKLLLNQEEARYQKKLYDIMNPKPIGK